MYIKVTEHAKERAWERFRWDANTTKSMLEKSFYLEELKEGTHEYQNNQVLWVINRRKDIITVITVRISRNVARVFTTLHHISEPVKISLAHERNKRRYKRCVDGKFKVYHG